VKRHAMTRRAIHAGLAMALLAMPSALSAHDLGVVRVGLEEMPAKLLSAAAA
jgi:hypothetical protein